MPRCWLCYWKIWSSFWYAYFFFIFRDKLINEDSSYEW